MESKAQPMLLPDRTMPSHKTFPLVDLIVFAEAMTGSAFEKILLSPEGDIGAAVAFSSILEYIQDRMKPADITDLIIRPEDELNSANKLAPSNSSNFQLHQHIAQLQASLDDANQQLYEIKGELADREARLQVMESMIMRKTFSTYRNPDVCMLDFEDEPTNLDVKEGMTPLDKPKKDQRA